MSIFDDILDKIGLHRPAAGMPATGPAAPGTTAKPPSMVGTSPGMFAPATAPMPMVDVMSKLNALGAKAPELDWKVSIVDMLKLLGMDSSLNARKALATELGCPADLMGGDYAKMNVWLHETVLQKIAQNGGNIPASLLNK